MDVRIARELNSNLSNSVFHPVRGLLRQNAMAISPLKNYFLYQSFGVTPASQQVMARSIERLTTGLRINRASDDPASFKTADGLSRLATNQSAAMKNANDAISVVQTADTTLENVSGMLVQMKELVTRSVNDSFTAMQRKDLMRRIGNLRDEINSMADRTTVNGMNLLRGDFSLPISGDFDKTTGLMTTSSLGFQQGTTYRIGSPSTVAVADTSVISVSALNISEAETGSYRFSSSGAQVTLTREVGGVSTSQTLTLTGASPTSADQVRIPTTAGETFTLDFSEIGVSTSFALDTLGTRNTPTDFATLIASIGTTPSPTGWQAVSGADSAQGSNSADVVAVISSSGGNLKLTSTDGLSSVTGYGAAATWTAGSNSVLGFSGTVEKVNAALRTLQVDATNGLGSIDVQITAQFKNSVFLDTTPVSSDPVEKKTVLPGWEIYTKQAVLGSTVIGGVTSSNSSNEMPTGSRGFATPAYLTANYSSFTYSSASFNYQASNDMPGGVSGKSLRLYSNMTTSSGSEVIHGPYLVSADPISIKAGDSVSFWWKSENGSDAYDSYAYLVNVDDPSQIELLDSTAPSDAAISTPWTKVTQTVNSTGNYKFVFVAGTFDYSGGQAAGGSLYVTDIQVTPAAPEPGTQQAINIGKGGGFSIGLTTEITDVAVTGVGGASADDGIYHVVADDGERSITLKQYDASIGALIRSETLAQGDALATGETREFQFEDLGVSISIRNATADALWLGSAASGFSQETLVAENKRLSNKSNAPTFQISDGSRFDVSIEQLRDIRIGPNSDAEYGNVFNAFNASITTLTAQQNPTTDAIQRLGSQIDALSETITELRSGLGATANRMAFSISSMTSQVSTLNSSQARIQNADYAAETSRLVQSIASQNIQLATMAHLNMQPKTVLWLLQ
jgi:flagellin-like hook-associated protein FlgL